MTSTLSSGKKRRRVDISQAVEEYTQRTSSSGYSRSASSTCGIEISDVDTDGKFIKLTNTTDKVTSILSQEIFYLFHNICGMWQML